MAQLLLYKEGKIRYEFFKEDMMKSFCGEVDTVTSKIMKLMLIGILMTNSLVAVLITKIVAVKHVFRFLVNQNFNNL